jgi:hypothetical protein
MSTHADGDSVHKSQRQVQDELPVQTIKQSLCDWVRWHAHANCVPLLLLLLVLPSQLNIGQQLGSRQDERVGAGEKRLDDLEAVWQTCKHASIS